MADDLQDEWWLEGDLTEKADDHEQTDTEEDPLNQETCKRKNDEKESVSEPIGEQDEPPAKKKKKKKSKAKDVEERDKAPTTPQDLITATKKHYDGKLSVLEWDEIKMEDSFFAESRTSSHTLSTYLRLLLPKWQQLIRVKTPKVTEEPGAPILLIITSAALRATQLNREIQEFKGDKCKMAKLFAKHYKVNDQVEFLGKSRIDLGIGTPSRIETLIDNGALKLGRLKRVVIDWSWRDAKLRRLVEMPDIRSQLFNLLKNCIIPRLKEGTFKLALM